MRKSTVLIFFSFLVFAVWLNLHTFSYDTKYHNLLMAQRVWSDFGSHIPLIRSFSFGNNFPFADQGKPPQYPLFPGQAIRYHFLFYFFVGMLERLGVRIDWALNIPSIAGFFLLLGGIFVLAKKLFKSELVALLSIIFFLFNGSLSSMYFFQKFPLSQDTLQTIIEARSFPAFAPWDNTEVTAFWNLNIYTNQRHLAMAFGIALLFLHALLRIESKSVKKQLPVALGFGIVFGLFPFFHQPTLLMIAVFEALYFLLFPKLRTMLAVSALVTAGMVLPQLSILASGTKGLGWYPGYLAHNPFTIGHVVRFWFLNLGLHGVLIPLGFIIAPRNVRKWFLPIFVIFILANLFKVSTEVAANHKFFNFALILGNMLSAYALIAVSRRLPSLLRIGVLVVLVGLLTISGVIDFFVVANDIKGSLPDIPSNKTAAWIARNTPQKAVFLNSSFLYHPASLAGRNVFLGWPYFAWSAGYDTNTRLEVMQTIYNSTAAGVLCRLLAANNIQFVTFQDRNAAEEIIFNEETFRTSFPLVFSDISEGYRIYDVEVACR